MAPLSALPLLNSLPGAVAKLVLDFDGNSLSSWGSYNNVVTPVYSTDGDLTTFTDQELANIHEIWERVSEDFAPFNINVTTIDPGAIADRVVAKIAIGGSDSDWYDKSAGGIAFRGGFYNAESNIGFAFTAQLNNGNPKSTAEAVSHESGHLFGLRHQSLWNGDTLIQEYNPGDATWAPIMGNSYAPALSTWWNGPTNDGANATEDNMGIISGADNGFGYRENQQGSIGNAVSIGSTGSVNVAGLIARNADAQWWKFSTTGGLTTLNVSPMAVGANLDSVLEIRDFTGSLLFTIDPGTSISATFSGMLAAGDYYAVVRSTGVYGRVGQYTLSGIVPLSHCAFLVANPSTGLLDLVVEGTSTDDNLIILLGSDASQLTVLCNGVNEGAFTPTGDVIVRGFAGVDRIRINGSLGGIAANVDGGDGDDVIVIGKSSGAGVVNVDGGLGADLVIVRRNVDFVASELSVVTSDGLTISTANVERTRLDGGNSSNNFNVTPSTTVTFVVNGFAPGFGSLTDVDSLEVQFSGTTGASLAYSGPPLGQGRWSFSNRLPVHFTGIEKIKYFPIGAVGSDVGPAGTTSSIKVFQIMDTTATEILTVVPFAQDYRYGVRIAQGDLNGDGIPEIIAAPGLLHPAEFKVIDVLTGSVVAALPDPFYGSRQDGWNVAIGDIDGDGISDVVFTPSRGTSETHIWRNTTSVGSGNFTFSLGRVLFPFQSTFIGGASLALADLTQDGRSEVLIGSGSGMRAAVRVYNATTASYTADYLPFEDSFRGGIFLAATFENLDLSPDIVVGTGQGGKGRVEILDGSVAGGRPVLDSFLAYTQASMTSPFLAEAFQSAVRVASIELDSVLGFPVHGIFTGQNSDGRSRQLRGRLAVSLTNFVQQVGPGFPGFYLG